MRIIPRMTEDPQDRRNATRAPIELKVEYKRLNSFFADYTRNISRGGTFIRTTKPLSIGTDFNFKLVVPKLEEPLVLRGRVQWVVQPDEAEKSGRDPGMGIGFIYGSEAERQRIEGIVEKLLVDSLGPHLFDKIMSRHEHD
ncbi:MAG: PilZ domain-containing protein [Myxococcota bacterium]